MNENVRNITVGITVLIALALLAGMIVLFTGLPEIFQGGYLIQIHFENTGGAHTGDLVYLLGIDVGRITEIAYVDSNDPNRGVKFVARIKRGVKLPGNVQAYIFTKSLVGGGAYVELKTDGKPRIDPRTGQVMNGILGIGLEATTLANEELMELFYNFYNPQTVERRKMNINQTEAPKA